MKPITEKEVRAKMRDYQRVERQAVGDFAEAVRIGNAELLVDALDRIEERCLWTSAMRARTIPAHRTAPTRFPERKRVPNLRMDV